MSHSNIHDKKYIVNEKTDKKTSLISEIDISKTIWSRREKNKHNNHPVVFIINKATDHETKQELSSKLPDNLSTPIIYSIIANKETNKLNTCERRYKNLPLTPNLMHFDIKSIKNKKNSLNKRKKIEGNTNRSSKKTNYLKDISKSPNFKLSEIQSQINLPKVKESLDKTNYFDKNNRPKIFSPLRNSKLIFSKINKTKDISQGKVKSKRLCCNLFKKSAKKNDSIKENNCNEKSLVI